MSTIPGEIPSTHPPARQSREGHAKVCFERLVENTREVLYRYRFFPSPEFEYINPAAKAVTGYSLEEFYRDPQLFYHLIHPGDLTILKRILSGQEVNQAVQVRWVHKDGSLVWVEQYTIPIYDRTGNVVALECMARQIQFSNDTTSSSTSRQRRQLLEISQSIAKNFSFVEVMRHILQALEDMLAFDTCSFLLSKEETSLLAMLERIRADYNSRNIRIGVIRPGNGVENLVMRSGKPEQLHQEHKIIIPVRTRESTLGVFVVTRKNGPAFTEDEYDLAQLCIIYASLAVENAHLCKQTESRSSLLTRLGPANEAMNHPFNIAEISEAIGQEALQLSGADRIGIFAFTPDGRLSRLWSRGLSLAYLGHVGINFNGLIENKAIAGPELILINHPLQIPERAGARLLAQAEGIQAMVVCPLVYGTRVIAAVVCYFNGPRAWSQDEIDALRLFARQSAIAFENTRLYEELEDTYLQTVLTLGKALDARDHYTADHSRRLADWAEETARELNCTDEEIQLIRWAALLHDIGKIGIPDSILRKAGPLTEEEWEVMRQHPILGAEIVAPVKKLGPVTQIIRHHQEKYDGTGYPDGLQGEEIPLAARILTVVDAYTAMTDDRIYRPARSKHEATAELVRCAGTHFDRQVVDVFSRLIEASPTI